MIVLDTNVISDLIGPQPSPEVIRWLNLQTADEVWTTAVTVYEMCFGVARLPEGKRKDQLDARLEHFLDHEIDHRVLAFDVPAAGETARLHAGRLKSGDNADVNDSMIAGIALANQATIATRNVRHFTGLSVPVVDPWKA